MKVISVIIWVAMFLTFFVCAFLVFNGDREPVPAFIFTAFMNLLYWWLKNALVAIETRLIRIEALLKGERPN